MLFAWLCGQVGKKDQGGLTEGRMMCFVYNLSDLEVCVFLWEVLSSISSDLKSVSKVCEWVTESAVAPPIVSCLHFL